MQIITKTKNELKLRTHERKTSFLCAKKKRDFYQDEIPCVDFSFYSSKKKM